MNEWYCLQGVSMLSNITEEQPSDLITGNNGTIQINIRSDHDTIYTRNNMKIYTKKIPPPTFPKPKFSPAFLSEYYYQ